MRAGSTSGDDRMSTYFRAVSRSGRRCPRLRCGEHGSSCPAGTSPVFSTNDAGCPICACRQLTAFLRPSTTCAPLDCSHLVCEGPVRFSSRLVGRCPVCECVAVDNEASGPTGPVTSSPCPELDCSDHFRCHGGRKHDPQTGCETCECADDCTDCAAVCASSVQTRCSAVCRCDVLCPPLPIDCELRVGCSLSIADNGCEICQCTVTEMLSTTPSSVPACPPMTCPLTCAEAGYAVDRNGCRVCACAVNEAESTTTATTRTPCGVVDCVTQCPGEFDVVKDDDGCDVCVCTKQETVSDSEEEATRSPCVCGPNDCSGGAVCESCNCSSVLQADRQRDDATATNCGILTEDRCHGNCVLATDDAGCQFCLCEDQETDAEVTGDPTTTTTTNDVRRTTFVAEDGDEVTTRKNVDDDMCEHHFICHPVCQTVTDDRGCVVECRCDELVDTLVDMRSPSELVRTESESRVMCATSDDVCSCSDGEEELWTATGDGCLTCVCVTPSTATTAQLTTTPSTTTRIAASEEVITSTIATTSPVSVECRQLSDGDCADLSCGDDGYAKDEKGCDVCSCQTSSKDSQPVKTVYHVVATARKGNVTCVTAVANKTSLLFRSFIS